MASFGCSRRVRLVSSFFADLRRSSDDLGISLFSFDGIDLQRSNGDIVRTPVKGFTLTGNQIHIRSDRSSWRAAVILFHEFQHVLSTRNGSSEGELDEIEIMYRHEIFALRMGLPELIPGARDADDFPSPVGLQGAATSDLYEGLQEPGLVVRSISGITPVPTNGWR